MIIVPLLVEGTGSQLVKIEFDWLSGDLGLLDWLSGDLGLFDWLREVTGQSAGNDGDKKRKGVTRDQSWCTMIWNSGR
ncbi:hypothetical protein RRG08_017316 [Elysia crispata]|uniref:Uncharacterized protein n=1 Tax=Elysia crispata TaxID=231223 RepID=A0AAE0ZTK8_9GAST|nr:hypothetical protein RRG08_017316 [Elysia crispata]